MDATRARRTRDRVRQGWYARYRQWRFARYLGFADVPESPIFVVAAGRPVVKERAAFGPVQGPAPHNPGAVSATSHRQARSLAVAAR